MGTKKIDACKKCYLPRKTETEVKEIDNRLINIDNYIDRGNSFKKAVNDIVKWSNKTKPTHKWEQGYWSYLNHLFCNPMCDWVYYDYFRNSWLCSSGKV